MSPIHLVIAIFMDFPKGLKIYSKGLFTILKTHFVVFKYIYSLDILLMHETLPDSEEAHSVQ